MSRSEPWVSVEATPHGYAVRFGGGDDWQFRQRLEALKRLPPGQRRFDPETRTWYVAQIARLWLRNWAFTYFAPAERSVPADWAERRPPPPPRPDPRADAYAALWLRPGAPPEVVRAAYRALAQLHHPDVGGDTETMKRVNVAFDALRKGAA